MNLKIAKQLTMWAIGAVLFGGLVVHSAPKGDSPSKAKHGAVQIATASATQVFTGVPGRNAFAIYNNGPNTIWCGWTSAVTTATGFPVASGSALSIDITYENSGSPNFYCIASTALQVSPTDTRWIQVK